jgi:hypothetical protein
MAAWRKILQPFVSWAGGLRGHARLARVSGERPREASPTSSSRARTNPGGDQALQQWKISFRIVEKRHGYKPTKTVWAPGNRACLALQRQGPQVRAGLPSPTLSSRITPDKLPFNHTGPSVHLLFPSVWNLVHPCVFEPKKNPLASSLGLCQLLYTRYVHTQDRKTPGSVEPWVGW